jgi:protein-S-isoprenylcysteine O-methyltransferase Ste14
MNNLSMTALVTLIAVMLCWVFFAGIFLLRKRPPKAADAKRDRFATLGIFLQGVGYFLVFFQPPHQPFLPLVGMLSGIAGIVFAIITVGIAVASGWLTKYSVRTLGKQWAMRARLVEGHQLITAGPYAYHRNPIYTGMLGMLIATGLATEHWIALIIATPIFVIGMVIRIRTEEKLLRAEFGEEFEEYARRVPAVLPGIY